MKNQVTLTHLGAAGWEISDGQTTILTDPYLSRLRYTGLMGSASTPPLPGDARKAYGPRDELVPDTAAIDARIARADCILVSHSHFNHTLDVPHIARRTGALVVGSQSTLHLMRAAGVPPAQLIGAHGGEDFEFGSFSLQVIPSLHSALLGKRYFDARVVPPDVCGPRCHGDDVEGGTFMYLVRLGGKSILWSGSMNYIEREVEGLRADAAVIAAGRQRLEIRDYTGRLLRATGFPPVVFANHWDEQSLPFGAPQDERLREAEVFAAEVRAAAPGTRVVIPGHFERHVLG